MNKKQLLFLSSLLLLLACINTKKVVEEEQPPNIIIILADDLGYSDLGCYGGAANTPHLNKLATEGIRFTDFYAAASNCSPSRVGLLTGRSPSKVGMYNYMPPKHPMHLKAKETTIAEIVQQKGYKTGHFGKWHLSNLQSDQPQPIDQGFDYSLGTSNNAQPSHLNPTNFVRNGQSVGEMQGYSCQIIVAEAIQWLTNTVSKKDPFLLYLAFHEPHKKVASPPELTAKYATYPKQDAEYLANVENMDKAIGNMLTALKNKGLDENTLILFASDNGSYRNGSNSPLLGGKSFVYEGGIRVPGILHWKGKIAANQTIDTPACLTDVLPTICEIVAIAPPNSTSLDGISLLPLIHKKPLNRTKPLSWFFYRTSPEIAMRIGDYVILGSDSDTVRLTHRMTQPDMDYIKNMTLENFEVYQLKSDIGQANNIDYTTLEMGQTYKNELINRLKEIQAVGPYWENLPPQKGKKRLKSEWRQLRPTGFSN